MNIRKERDINNNHVQYGHLSINFKICLIQPWWLSGKHADANSSSNQFSTNPSLVPAQGMYLNGDSKYFTRRLSE